MSNGSARVLWSDARRSAESEFLRQPDEHCIVDGCNRPPRPGLKRVVLCQHHVDRLVDEMRESRPTVLKPMELPVAADRVVYYIRFADHIKIGRSWYLYSRMQALHVHPDTLLAVEPGDNKIERQRHVMFADERVARTELFHPSPRLLEHIEHVRSLFGDPKSFLLADVTSDAVG